MYETFLIVKLGQKLKKQHFLEFETKTQKKILPKSEKLWFQIKFAEAKPRW